MKPLFSAEEEANAASAVPSTVPATPTPALPPLFSPAGTDALPALRPEASAAPLVRVDISGIDDKAIESLGGATGASVAKVSAKLLGTVRASDADVFGAQLNELIATAKGLDPAKLRSGGLMARVTGMLARSRKRCCRSTRWSNRAWTPWWPK